VGIHCKKGVAALLSFAFALSLALTGCTTVGCAGSAVSAGPTLAFTAKDWASAHPDTDLTVCFGSECSTINTGSKYYPAAWPLRIINASTPSASSYPVTVDARTAGKSILHTRSTATPTQAPCRPSPCGCATILQVNLALSADGSLAAGTE